MKSFVAFLKKEIMESVRSGKFMLFAILFTVFGIMNPAIAKLTPWMLELFAEEMAESGMVITTVTVDALTSWTQFFKNVPMALIAFVCVYSGIFTKEYESETLVLILTKGLAKYKVVLAKTLLLLSVWSLGYWLCFAVTYAYNAYYWNNSIAVGLIPATVNYWLFGVFTLALMVLFSVLVKNNGLVLLGTGGSVLAVYLVGLIPKLSSFAPTALTQSAALLVGNGSASDYTKAVITAAVISVACIIASIPIMNKKQI